MDQKQEKFNVTINISLLALALLTMMNLTGQLIYAAPTPTSGYSRGCVDAYIPDHSEEGSFRRGSKGTFGISIKRSKKKLNCSDKKTVTSNAAGANLNTSENEVIYV